jgi:hypothetical protein
VIVQTLVTAHIQRVVFPGNVNKTSTAPTRLPMFRTTNIFQRFFTQSSIAQTQFSVGVTRRLHSELLHVVSALLEWTITRKELATAHDSRSLNV